MDLDILARCLHVVGVVIWIGGVALVSTAVLPAAAARGSTDESLALFEAIERRFAPQARAATLVVGATGLWLTFRYDLWSRFAAREFWWMHAMVGLWLVFTLMLFILEPLVLHHRERAWATAHPRIHRVVVSAVHWLLLLAGLLTIAGAVAGSHGGNLW